MNRRLLNSRATCAVMLLLLASGANSLATTARPLDDAALQTIRFDQHVGQSLSLALSFRDETGTPVALGQYFHGQPVIIVPGYYGCPMLCGQVANGLIEALQDITALPGRDFEIVFVSINPAESPELAAQKKRSYLKRYGRAQSESGWHFLTGSQQTVQTLADQIGFRYAYDSASKQYAHPSGAVVARADGLIAQYLFGVTYSARDLSAAVKNAAIGEVQSPIKELLLLCFHYTPVTGKYGLLVMMLVRVAAIGTLFALGGAILALGRRTRRKVA